MFFLNGLHGQKRNGEPVLPASILDETKHFYNKDFSIHCTVEGVQPNPGISYTVKAL